MWNTDYMTTDSILATIEKQKEKLYEEALVVLCNPKTKKLIMETKEFKNASNLYIAGCNDIPENTVYGVEEPILKRHFIELAIVQEEKERIENKGGNNIDKAG